MDGVTPSGANPLDGVTPSNAIPLDRVVLEGGSCGVYPIPGPQLLGAAGSGLGQGWGRQLPSLIRYNNGTEITFPLMLKILTRQPRGKELPSYYDAEVLVRLTAEEL